MTSRLNIKRLCATAILPTRSTPHAAGLDLYSVVSLVLFPNTPTRIRTGIAMQIPHGFVGQIWDRSGMGARGIGKLAGVIDSDYEGEVVVVLLLAGHEPVRIREGDRIAQLLIVPILPVDVVESWEDRESLRGDRGFGSTGA